MSFTNAKVHPTKRERHAERRIRNAAARVEMWKDYQGEDFGRAQA